MKNTLLLFGLVVAVILPGSTGCKKKVKGCTARTVINYNPDAVEDDDSCVYKSSKFLGTHAVV